MTAAWRSRCWVWLALCWGVLPRLALPSILPPVILFAGLALILVENTRRGASRA